MAIVTSRHPRPAYTARPGEAIRVFRNAGADFAIGCGRVTIASDNALFMANVISDLGRIVAGPTGEEVLKEGDALGHPVRIMQQGCPTDPPNGWTIPDDLAAASAVGASLGPARGRAPAGTGAGCGSAIVYDPADWPLPGDPRSPSSADILLMMLRQANRNARGASDPSKPDWGAEEGEQ
jgi:hypothetical protein